jgi:hypothetical protein
VGRGGGARMRGRARGMWCWCGICGVVGMERPRPPAPRIHSAGTPAWAHGVVSHACQVWGQAALRGARGEGGQSMTPVPLNTGKALAQVLGFKFDRGGVHSHVSRRAESNGAKIRTRFGHPDVHLAPKPPNPKPEAPNWLSRPASARPPWRWGRGPMQSCVWH